ncbi:hypothetical protein H0H93_011446 [Arthromyces matolae]|nr:hypothetical protein H0H93_011446 [Arthromyces matolae]
MSKRKLVPAALHFELTEYSSLLRALRARNSLDVTSHLAKRARLDLSSDSEDDDSDSQDGHDSQEEYETDAISSVHPPTSSAPLSRDVSPSVTGRPTSPDDDQRRQHSQSQPRRRRREAWTRWPLLVDDLHVPEWSIDDEVGLLADRVLKPISPPALLSQPLEGESSQDPADPSVDPSMDVDIEQPSHHSSAHTAKNYLSTILALLAAHSPNRPDSQQNRVEPMGWREVLNVLASCDDPNIADAKIISSVKTRMESLYNSTATELESEADALVTHRIQCGSTARQKLKEALSAPIESLLTFPPTPENWEPPPRQRVARKSRRRPVKTPLRVENVDDE